MRTKNVLFVCSQNVCRSVTGELVFRNYHPDLWVRSCGTDTSAVVPINRQLVRWADLAVCFEQEHARAVALWSWRNEVEPKVVTLELKDEYNPMDPELVAILKARMPQFLDPLISSTPAARRPGNE